MSISDLLNQLKWEILEQKSKTKLLETVENLKKEITKKLDKQNDKISGLSAMVKVKAERDE